MVNPISMHPERQLSNMAPCSKGFTPDPGLQTEPVTSGKKQEGTVDCSLPFLRRVLLRENSRWKGRQLWEAWRRCTSEHRKAEAPTRTPALLTSASPQDLATLSMKHSSGHRPGRVGNSLHIQLLALPSRVALLRKATIQCM